MPDWFVARDGQQRGPFDAQTLQRMVDDGRIIATDSLWCEGMANWALASQIQGLVFPQGSSPAASAVAVAAPAAPKARPIVLDYQGPVAALGNQFSFEGRRYTGAVLASSDAICLVKQAVPSPGGGLGGRVVGDLLTAAVQCDDTGGSHSCLVRDLPMSMRARLRQVEDDVPVVLILKAAITMVKVPAINNCIYLRWREFRVTVFTTIFTNGKRRRELKSLGWVVNTPVGSERASTGSHDRGPVAWLGKEFGFDGKGYGGAAIATTECIYLARLPVGNPGGFSVGFHAGLVGGLLAAALEGDGSGPQSCLVSDIPGAVRARMLKIPSDVPVIVLPKSAVTLIRINVWNNSLTIWCGKVSTRISLAPFVARKRRRQLQELGWIVNQQIQATENLSITYTPPVKPVPLWLRILLITAAIIIFIGVIVLRAMLSKL